jgi:predicted DCC family thiol-disulfide oxidoreductase YuxK
MEMASRRIKGEAFYTRGAACTSGPSRADGTDVAPDRERTYPVSMPLLVLYDGACGLCTGSAAWLARHDRRGALLFSPLASPEAAPYRSAAFTAGDTTRPDTLVVVERAGDREVVRVRADAVASALRALGPPWSLAGLALGAAPRRLADAAYRAVARRRSSKP